MAGVPVAHFEKELVVPQWSDRDMIVWVDRALAVDLVVKGAVCTGTIGGSGGIFW